jgi:hypothetical protein
MILTRRNLIMLAGAGVASWGRLDATVMDFWNKKPPADWDSEEIERLLHKSPWARAVTAQYAPGEAPRGQYPQGGGYPGGGGNPGGGYPGGRVGLGIPGVGIGMPRGRRGGGMPPGSSQQTNEHGTVRWESAQVVLDAVKSPLPEAFKNHYVVSVSGIPLRDRRGRAAETNDDDRDTQDSALDNLKQLTTLGTKGKEPAQPGVVLRGTREYSMLLFGFSKEFLNFSRKDHEVHFATQLGSLEVKTKFDLSEMKYHKELSV